MSGQYQLTPVHYGLELFPNNTGSVWIVWEGEDHAL